MTSEVEIIQTAAGPARLKRSRRRTLAISVLPDGKLEITAPERSSVPAILVKVEGRVRWIETQRSRFRAMDSVRPARRYVSGATHRYLGRQYRLKVSVGAPANVSLRGGHFYVVIPTRDEDAVRERLDQWFRVQARRQLGTRLQRWHQWCASQKLPPPRLRLRSMNKRWGSAHADGSISFNPDLIRTPSVCVDYVIAHEVAHLKVPNHGKAFYWLLDQLCPNWRAIKMRLERAEI